MNTMTDDCQDLNSDLKSIAWSIAAAVPDPEIPLLTIADLGILRAIDVTSSGQLVVHVSPTYSGCPAVEVIEQSIAVALENGGFSVRIQRVFSPAWTTDWITPEGRRKLREYGIAPPGLARPAKSVAGQASAGPECPRCNSSTTTCLSAFGSTPCKAMYRCDACREPFEYFKCL